MRASRIVVILAFEPHFPQNVWKRPCRIGMLRYQANVTPSTQPPRFGGFVFARISRNGIRIRKSAAALAFVLTNNSNYCVTHFEWEVELQTDTGESWRETGVTSTASPMHGEMPYNELLRNNNEHQTRISVFAGRVTKAWGFPIPQDRQRGENR